MYAFADKKGRICSMEARPSIRTVDRLGQVVREARAEQKLTQAQLAQKAHVGRLFVMELEAGHPRAELGKVLDVLEALGLQLCTVPVAPEQSRSSTSDQKGTP